MDRRVDHGSAVQKQGNGNSNADGGQSTLVKIIQSFNRSRTKAGKSASYEDSQENGVLSDGRSSRQSDAGSLFSSLRISKFSRFSRANESSTTLSEVVSSPAKPASLPIFDFENAACKLLPVPQTTSPAEVYSRLLLQHLHGYPLYQPGPDPRLPPVYQKRGVSVGDVGIVTRDGSFDFLFNVCPSRAYVNPPALPANFEQLLFDDFSSRQYIQPQTHLCSSGVRQLSDSPPTYKCSGPEGVVLELPKGAFIYEARNRFVFRDLAARHAQDWYKYAVMKKARDAPNGSLYLVTRCIKASNWGIAVFDEPSSSHDYLRFISDEASPQRDQNAGQTFSWKKTGVVTTKIGPSPEAATIADDEESNQCLFLHGYRIMLQQRAWDGLVNGGAVSPGETASSSGRQTDPWGSDSVATLNQDRGLVTLKEHSSGPLTHPSNFINTMLLQSESHVKVALTHDDEWCATLPDQFTTSNSCLKVDELCRNVSRAYAQVVDEYGCISLVKSETSAPQ